tara:strand:- start:30920 stop:32449 length:1530 start_codon:yes stop_codon:yes gene_type:complete
MTEPANKIASDLDIIEAIKNYDSKAEAAHSLGMAPKTLYNRLNLMKQKQPEEKRPESYKHDKSVQRFFISSVVSNAPLHKKGFKAVQVMCNHLGAQQVYIPVQYDWQDVKQGREDPSYPKQVADCLLSSDVELNKHVNLMGSVPIHATVVNPLTGMTHVAKGKSAIFGHPQIAMQSIATSKFKIPKLLYCTGAITEPRYTRSKAGRKAQDHHDIGGLIVEVSDDRFHVFEIRINDDGSFYHLTNKYTTNGVESYSGVSGVVLADEHVDGIDQHVVNATYTDEDSIIRTFNPEYVVHHDFHNHTADSHHSRNNVMTRIIINEMGASVVKDELDYGFNFMRKTTVEGTKNVMVASNHHDHLTRWLNEFNPHRGDVRNVLFYHQLNAAVIEEYVTTKKNIEPYEMYCKNWHPDVYENCKFLSRDEEFEIAGIDCSNHGDGFTGQGGFLRTGKRTIIGHSHSPKLDKTLRVGGCCSNDLGYNKGLSGWLATHSIIYPDGNQTFVHIIDGKWRL